MTVHQLTYRVGGLPGLGEYTQADSRVDRKLCERVEPLFEGCDTAEPLLSYSLLPDGSGLLCRAEGPAVRALYLERGALELSPWLPADLSDAPIWASWAQGPGAESALAPMAGRAVALAGLSAFVRDTERRQPGRLARFLADLRRLYAPVPGRQLVLIASAPDVLRYVQVAGASLPPRTARTLTFTTQRAEPRIAFQQVVGAPHGAAAAFAKTEAEHQYRVHDLVDGCADSPSGRSDPWAEAVVQQWLDGVVNDETAELLWKRLAGPHAATRAEATEPAIEQPSGRPSPADSRPAPGQAVATPAQTLARPPAVPVRPPAAPVSPPAVPVGPPTAAVVPPAAEVRPQPRPAPKAGRPAATEAEIAALFRALEASAEQAATALSGVADVELGEIPLGVAMKLGERLSRDEPFVVACQTALSALRDAGLRDAALRDLDERAGRDPLGVYRSPGLRSLAAGPLAALVPDGCDRLRVLVAAADMNLATGPRSNYGADADERHAAAAARLLGLLRRARAESAEPAEHSPLAVALALVRIAPEPVPIGVARHLVAACMDQAPRLLTAPDALETLADAALRAPVAGPMVPELAAALARLPVPERSRAALQVLIHADRFDQAQDTTRIRLLLEDLARQLHSATAVRYSAAVEQWWIGRVLTAVFRPGGNIWLDTVDLLVASRDPGLIHQYASKVQVTRAQELVAEPLLAAEAMAAWMLAPEDGANWLTERQKLLKWAAGLLKRSQEAHGIAAARLHELVPAEVLQRHPWLTADLGAAPGRTPAPPRPPR